MLKTFKWIYNLGVKQERNRIKLLIKDYQDTKPNESDFKYQNKYDNNDLRQANFETDLSIWYGVTSKLNRLIEPSVPVEKTYTEYQSPLEEGEK
jgi:hypothetical protein